LRVGYAMTPSVKLVLDVFNVFDRQVSDIEYFYTSRLAAEAAQHVHFHPAEPRSLRVTLTARF
jgi:hypothetical protein